MDPAGGATRARRPRFLAPWRRGFQWVATLAVVGVPFLEPGGRSLLRVDLPSRSIFAFGQVIRVEELYLILILSLALILTFLAVTLVLGRVWCGWACPQTVWADAWEGFLRLLGARIRGGRIEARPWQRVLAWGFAALLGLLVGCNLVWYFLSPYAFFPRLAAGTLPAPAALTVALVGGAVFLDLVLLRRTFCTDFCPYGRFQTVLVDRGTLTLRLLPGEAPRCIDCGACQRACPTGIDVRQGYDVQCINCGRCVDACRQVMGRRREEGLIGYTFGVEGWGPRALFNPRTGLVAVLGLVAWAALAVAAGQREPASFSLRASATAPARVLASGEFVAFFSGYLANRGRAPLRLSLEAAAPDGAPLGVKGPVTGLELSPGEHRRIDFVISVPAGMVVPPAARLVWRDPTAGPVARARAPLPGLPKAQP